MKRFNTNELSTARIYHAILRRIKNVFDTIAWYYPSKLSLQNQTRLAQYDNKHLGKRCFIIGNGPSISKMDLSPLKSEITFGLNRIYLAFDRLPFMPTYYVCVNELVLEQFAPEINELPMPKFLNWNRRDYFDSKDSSVCFLNFSLALRDGFTTNINNKFYSGGTVTYVAIQLAYIMGFSEIILIGVDHSFKDKGIPNKVEVRTSDEDTNHFHPNYFPKGVKWQLPDLLRSEHAYMMAREKIENRGRFILDATENGKLTVFEKAIFKDMVNETD